MQLLRAVAVQIHRFNFKIAFLRSIRSNISHSAGSKSANNWTSAVAKRSMTSGEWTENVWVAAI